MPGTAEAYTHRTGRTGRANQSGEALTFTTVEDGKMIVSLKRTLGKALVYKDHAVADITASLHKAHDTEKNYSDTIRKPHRKMRGKRSSQRNRMAAFDFGL